MINMRVRLFDHSPPLRSPHARTRQSQQRQTAAAVPLAVNAMNAVRALCLSLSLSYAKLRIINCASPIQSSDWSLRDGSLSHTQEKREHKMVRLFWTDSPGRTRCRNPSSGIPFGASAPSDRMKFKGITRASEKVKRGEA